MHAGQSKWPKNDGFPSAEMTELSHFILSKKYFSSKWPSLAADGNTIMNLP
jgi:hypothetical protein